MRRDIKVIYSSIIILLLMAGTRLAYAGMVAAEDEVNALKSASASASEMQVSVGHGTVRGLSGRFAITPKKDTSEAVLDFIDTHKRAFGLADPRSELRLSRKKEYKEGDRHFRYQQTYKGLVVWGKQVLVTVNPDNEIDDITADYIQTTLVETTPSVSAADAVQKALDTLTERKQSGEQWKLPETELLIYPSGASARLAYLVKISISSPPGWWFFFIDAQDGSIIKSYNNIKYDNPVPGSGTLWDDSTVSINLYNHSGTYFLADSSKPMSAIQPTDFTGSYTPFLSNGTISAWDANNLSSYSSTTQMTDPDADGNVYKSESGGRLTSGVNTLNYHGLVYDFFKTNFGRDSWDNSGGSLLGVAHYGSGFNNAFWNGAFMTYGDGSNVDGGLTDLSQGLDVVAHEIGHGVTQSEVPPVGLNYWAQAGAMNEHISDYWGISVDSANYLIGESIMPAGSSYTALRDFANPADTGVISPQPATMQKFYYSLNDAAGVHTNSGILSKAACQMIISPVIGRDKTQQIYYKAYDYLTPDCHFYDLKEALKKAAKSLYPDDYKGIAGAINTIYNASGITAPPFKQNLQYYKDPVQGYFNAGYLGLYGFGTFFVPYYSGTLDGVDVRFTNTNTAADNRVEVDVFDISPAYDFNLLYSTTVTVTNFSNFTYVPLAGTPFTHSFVVMVYPYSSNPGIAAEDNPNNPVNAYAVNLGDTGSTFYVLPNLYIRPHVSYDFTESLYTLGFQQNGGTVTVNTEIDRMGAASGASIKFEASSDGGVTWILKTTGTSDSNGFCTKSFTLVNGEYKLRARYDSGTTHLVSAPLLEVAVQPVVTAALSGIVSTSTPAVSWSAFNYPAATVTGYEVQISKSSTFTTIDGTKTYDAGATGGTLPKLAIGVKYYWRVIAGLATGKSVPSASYSVTYKEPTTLGSFDARESVFKMQPSVTLLDSLGGPVPGRTIVFSYRKPGVTTWSSLGTAKTNYTGKAWLTAAKTLVAGTYDVKAAFAGDTLYASAADAGPVKVALPATDARGGISVLVKDFITGLVVPNATVNLYSTASTKTPVSAAATDAGGAALFANLAESFKYTVKVSSPGYIGVTCYNIAVTESSSASVNLNLVPSAVSSTGNAGGTITDNAVSSPISGAAVKLRAGVNANTTSVLKTATTAGDGAYIFSGLNAGVYTAEISKTGYKQNFFILYCAGGVTTLGQDATTSLLGQP